MPFFASTITVDAYSPQIYEYLDTGYDNDTAAIYGVNVSAMQFTPAYTHSVTSISIPLMSSGTPGAVTVSIRNASGGLPTGQDIITFNTVSSITTYYAWITFTISSSSPQNTLTANTQYAIVVKVIGGTISNYITWQIDSGGSLANSVASHSTDGGTVWVSDTPKDALFVIFGYPAFSIGRVAEFDNYLETNDMLFTFEYINTYPPYYSNGGIPSSYFVFQLVGADNTTIIGATPMQAWGDKPGSIYINKSTAQTLSKNSTFYIKMVGLVSPYPVTSYHMTTGDWRGLASPGSTSGILNIFNKITGDEPASELDKWVLATATSIDSYNYTTFGTTDSLTTYIDKKGQVLASDTKGISYFVLGIPSLRYVRPNLFEVVTSEMPVSNSSFTNGYNNAGNFDSIVGTTVSGDMDALGNLFGVTSYIYDPAKPTDPGISVAQKTTGTLLMIVAVLLALFGIMAVGSGFAPVSLLLSMPIMFWGAQIRAIDIRLIGLIIFILFFLCIRRYIWVEG